MGASQTTARFEEPGNFLEMLFIHKFENFGLHNFSFYVVFL